jgi:hypothetical protein
MGCASSRPPGVLAVTRAFAAIRANHEPPTDEQPAELRSKVCPLTDEMKRARAVPERVVLRPRALAHAAEFDSFNDPLVREAVR